MALQQNSRPNGKLHKGDLAAGEAQCPTCNSPISVEKFAEIQGTQRTHDAEIERAVEARFGREIAKIEAGRNGEVAKAVRAARAVAEKKLQLIRKNQDAAITARVQVEREAAAKRQTEAVNSERLTHAEEKLRLETALAAMQRKLASKPAHQIGEPAEVDLYDALVAALPGDRIGRVRKGAKGPDVVVEIVHQQVVVGKIALDSKAHSRWSNKFTVKLRADQLAYRADFGVLVSTAFPAGTAEMHLQDGVVVVSPARVLALMQLLRRHIIETHRLRITGRARNEKAEALLVYIVSPEANDLLERLRKATEDMVDLQVREVDQHNGIWRRRGELIRMAQTTHEELVAAIDGIVSADISMAAPESEVAA